MNPAIYGIYDTVAETIVGMLVIHRHESAAIRMFVQSLAALEQQQQTADPKDFELRRYGYLDEKHTEITIDRATIMTGAQLIAARTKNAS